MRTGRVLRLPPGTCMTLAAAFSPTAGAATSAAGSGPVTPPQVRVVVRVCYCCCPVSASSATPQASSRLRSGSHRTCSVVSRHGSAPFFPQSSHSSSWSSPNDQVPLGGVFAAPVPDQKASVEQGFRGTWPNWIRLGETRRFKREAIRFAMYQDVLCAGFSLISASPMVPDSRHEP